VVIDDLDFVSVAVAPHKANAPLVVNANTVLTVAAAFHSFQAMTWVDGQDLKAGGRIKNLQFVPRPLLNHRW